MSSIGKSIILIGIGIVLIGVIVYFLGDKLSWLGKLPGDIRIENERTRFYFPITTMVIISVLLNVIIWAVKQFLK